MAKSSPISKNFKAEAFANISKLYVKLSVAEIEELMHGHMKTGQKDKSYICIDMCPMPLI